MTPSLMEYLSISEGDFDYGETGITQRHIHGLQLQAVLHRLRRAWGTDGEVFVVQPSEGASKDPMMNG